MGLSKQKDVLAESPLLPRQVELCGQSRDQYATSGCRRYVMLDIFRDRVPEPNNPSID